MNKHDLRQIIGREEFSYQCLMVVLKDYKAPLQKLNQLLKEKQIIRVKKGLYVINPDETNSYNLFLIANLIYGPSYISFESALSYWGLIPERVETVSSVTSKRNKQFNTPIGQFSYRHSNLKKYRQGVLLHKQGNGDHVFIATPEKAILDYITLSLKKSTKANFLDLINDLRIDEKELAVKVKISNLRTLLKSYSHPLCFDFLTYLESKDEEDG